MRIQHMFNHNHIRISHIPLARQEKEDLLIAAMILGYIQPLIAYQR